MAFPIVFFDIAGEDVSVLQKFYAEVFDWQSDEQGSFSVPVAGPMNATLRQDPNEKRLYIGVPDISVKLSDVSANGGTVEVERFEVPGVVVLGLFRDPAGNPMGLVEMEGDAPKVP